MRNLPEYERFLFEAALNEIGDAKPIQWDDIKIKGNRTTYEFYLGPELYEVEIFRLSDISMTVSFKADGDDVNVTNSGFPLTVFATVVYIVKDYISKNPSIEKFSFVPEKEDEKDERRYNIYMHYIKNHFDVKKIVKDSLPRGYVSVIIYLK